MSTSSIEELLFSHLYGFSHEPILICKVREGNVYPVFSNNQFNKSFSLKTREDLNEVFKLNPALVKCICKIGEDDYKNSTELDLDIISIGGLELECHLKGQKVCFDEFFKCNENSPKGDFVVIHSKNAIGQTESSPREQERLKNLANLSSKIAHEIKNPLSIVQGNLEKILDTYKENQESPDPQVLSSLLMISKSSQRIKKIINNVKRLSTQEEIIKTFNVHEVINDAVDFFKEMNEEKFLKIDLSLMSESFYLEGDEVAFFQVITNLLNNARDAMEGVTEPVLAVKTSRVGIHNSIQITDSGCGISKSDLSKVFKDFFSTKKKTGGTGLGMGIIKKIVQKLDGKIQIESQVGIGTTLDLFFPIMVLPENIAAKNEESLINPEGVGKVLLVEDEEDVGDVLFNILKKLKLEVDYTPCPNFAQKLAKENKYGLLITDVNMPNINGVELAKIIKKIQDIPIAFSSGNARDEIVKEFGNELNPLGEFFI